MNTYVDTVYDTARSVPELMTEVAAKELITETVEAAYKKELEDWYREGERDSDSRASWIFSLCVAFVASLAIISITYVTLLHDRQESAALASCGKGEYTSCIEGWLNNTGNRQGDSLRLQAYEDSYYNATGKSLISAEQKQLKVKAGF